MFADAGYQGASKRPDARTGVAWRIAMRPGKRRTLDKGDAIDALVDKVEKLKASVRAKVPSPLPSVASCSTRAGGVVVSLGLGVNGFAIFGRC